MLCDLGSFHQVLTRSNVVVHKALGIQEKISHLFQPDKLSETDAVLLHVVYYRDFLQLPQVLLLDQTAFHNIPASNGRHNSKKEKKNILI